MDGEELSKALLSVLAVVGLYVIGMMVGAAAFADSYMMKDPLGNTLKIYDRPCTDGKVLAFITMRGGRVDDFKDGVMFYEGKTYAACWAASQDGNVYVIDEAGDMSRLPMQLFQKVTEV